MTDESASTTGGGGRVAPPRLHFDDGSRIMTETSTSSPNNNANLDSSSNDNDVTSTPRGAIPLNMYYETSRTADEIVSKLNLTSREPTDDGLLCRVALQFPDELLPDSVEVCWLMEEAISEAYDRACSEVKEVPLVGEEDAAASAALKQQKPPLVFILGDSTANPCCPDEISAHHLNADILVHYGHACLSPTESLPVIYSFGITEMDVEKCAEVVSDETRKESVTKLLLLYEVRYHHAVERLRETLLELGGMEEVLVGKIPEYELVDRGQTSTSGCCGTKQSHSAECCGESSTCSAAEPPAEQVPANETPPPDGSLLVPVPKRLVVGGLELPPEADLSAYTLLFLGSCSDGSRQYLNLMLRTLSSSSGQWTYDPRTQELSTTIPPAIRRQLNRRFYLTQKARDSSIIGILVGTLTQRHVRTVVHRLQNLITDTGRTAYTFAVGKINVAKLANFAEVDCYVLVSCGETSLLEEEREYHVPIVTPLELEMAIGKREWGGEDYSLDYNDFLAGTAAAGGEDDGKEGDEPYFSLVTGRYESSVTHHRGAGTEDESGEKEAMDLMSTPGAGQVTTYRSASAEFWRKREYRGLEANVGGDEVKGAVEGRVGIASDYGEKR